MTRADRLDLVVTLGPSSFALAASLAAAGATAFRVNASHLDPDALDGVLTALRQACPSADVVLDLQGAKMRLLMAQPLPVSRGDHLRLSLAPAAPVRVPHVEFYQQVRRGDTLSMDDGRLHFRVEKAGDTDADLVALDAGVLLPRKGVNVNEHPIEPHELTETDRRACAIGSRHGVSTFAFSFMTDGREAAWLRSEVPGCCVVGKIERREAVRHLAAIARCVDAMWICRGDLGAQLGPAALARFVAGFEPARCPVPVLMAGQVFEHLTGHREPTRSEVCHLYDLVTRGYAGVVLSDETAVGHAPAGSTSQVAALLAAFRA